MKTKNVSIWILASLCALIISSCNNSSSKIDRETDNSKSTTSITESNSDNKPSSSNSQVDLSRLPPIQVIQAYAAGKTFVADNGWKFKIQSGIEVYMNGNLFGSISEYYDVRINSNNGRQYFPFNVVSPYNHAEFMFAFYPPDIIRDQEGRNYYLK